MRSHNSAQVLRFSIKGGKNNKMQRAEIWGDNVLISRKKLPGYWAWALRLKGLVGNRAKGVGERREGLYSFIQHITMKQGLVSPDCELSTVHRALALVHLPGAKHNRFVLLQTTSLSEQLEGSPDQQPSTQAQSTWPTQQGLWGLCPPLSPTFRTSFI